MLFITSFHLIEYTLILEYLRQLKRQEVSTQWGIRERNQHI